VGSRVFAHLGIAEDGQHPHVVGHVLTGDLDVILGLSKGSEFQEEIQRESDETGRGGWGTGIQ